MNSSALNPKRLYRSYRGVVSSFIVIRHYRGTRTIAGLLMETCKVISLWGLSVIK